MEDFESYSRDFSPELMFKLIYIVNRRETDRETNKHEEDK